MSAYSIVRVAGVDEGLVKKAEIREILEIRGGSLACFPPVF